MNAWQAFTLGFCFWPGVTVVCGFCVFIACKRDEARGIRNQLAAIERERHKV